MRALRSWLVGAAVLAVASTTTSARAYRPFDGTDADVAEHGEFELEFGPIGYIKDASGRSIVAPATVLNLGFVPRAELVLQGNQTFTVGDVPPGGTRMHFVDTALLVKILLREGELQEKSGLSVATEIGPLLPQYHDDSHFGASAALMVSHRIDAGTAHLNVQLQRLRDSHFDLFTGLIVEGPIQWTLRPVAEGYLEKERDGLFRRSILGGGIWRVSDALAIDAAVRGGREADTNLIELRAGLTLGVRVFGDEPPKAENATD